MDIKPLPYPEGARRQRRILYESGENSRASHGGRPWTVAAGFSLRYLREFIMIPSAA
jgi:hypothetical protein